MKKGGRFGLIVNNNSSKSKLRHLLPAILLSELGDQLIGALEIFWSAAIRKTPSSTSKKTWSLVISFASTRKIYSSLRGRRQKRLYFHLPTPSWTRLSMKKKTEASTRWPPATQLPEASLTWYWVENTTRQIQMPETTWITLHTSQWSLSIKWKMVSTSHWAFRKYSTNIKPAKSLDLEKH